jgi:predicted enzyme related to lactoylglutathione lyase
MKIIGFNHFQLDSMDVERTRGFYEALGGRVAQTMEREGGWKGYHVRLAQGVVIEIQPPRIPGACGGSDGWDHLALEVDNCASACEMVSQAGGRIEKPPTANRMGAAPIVNAVAYGLDGEKIELVQVLSRHPAGREKQGSATILCASHMQLNTSDVERSRVFYEAAFDGTVLSAILERDGKSLKGYLVQIAPGSVLEVQPPRFGRSGKTSAWNTIAIETDDIAAACKKIEAAGGIREVGPMKGSMGTVEILNAVVIGPENEHIELIELL